MANSNLLRMFIVVAEEGSITKASEKLYISQPAITKAIKELEAEMGGKLFVRKNRGVELTTEGKNIFEKAKPLMKELDGLYDYFSNVTKLKAGVLRIGTTTSNITILLSPIIGKFINAFPNISQLRNNELDVAVLDKDQVKPDLDTCKEFVVSYSVVGSKSYFEKYQNRPMTKEEFASLPLALISPEHTSRNNVDIFFTRHNISLPVKYELDNYGLIIDFIKKGLAVGIVNLDYFGRELEKGEIFKLNTDFEIDKRVISVVEYNQKMNNPAKDIFVKMLKEEK